MLRLLTFLSAVFLASAAAATTLWVDAPRDGYLNLRQGPSVQYHVLGKMPHGSKVTLLRSPGKWVKVRHASGKIGWAYSGFLTERNPVKGFDRDHHRPKGQAYWVDAPQRGRMNLRTGPGRNYRVIDKIPHGAKTRVFYKQNGWYKLDFDGQIGWANSRFLTNHKVKGHKGGYYKDHTPAPILQPTGRWYWVDARGYSGLNLRSGPGTDHHVLLTMQQRDKVAELGRQGNWIHLRHSSGRTGWAHSDYLAKKDPGYAPAANAGRHGNKGKDRFEGTHSDADISRFKPGKTGGKKSGQTFDSLADAIAACAGQTDKAFESCVTHNFTRIR